MTSELRHRHQATSQQSSQNNDDTPVSSGQPSSSTMVDNTSAGDSPLEKVAGSCSNRSRNMTVTEIPALQENGEPATERTEIPSSPTTTTKTTTTTTTTNENVVNLTRLGDSSTRLTLREASATSTSSTSTSTTVKSQQAQVAKAESKVRKIMTRAISGALMIALFLGMVYMGHLYICLLVALVELLLFRELVKVRYSAYFNTIQDTIPLFRTTQWLWFAVAIFYTYGDFFREIIIQGNPEFHSFQYYAHFIPSLSFLLYSGTFVMTIATMQVGHIKFQLNQLCWTIVVLCLTVGQLKYIMHNIFNGLFWFALPILLVVTNDIMAYVSGMTCGRKFIRRKFISFSPNKTWEGFIGGWIFTMLAAWYISKFLAQFPWMHCPTNKFEFAPQPLRCIPDPIFVPANLSFPSQVFDLLPRYVSRLFPNVVEICSVLKNTTTGGTSSVVGAGGSGPILVDADFTMMEGSNTHIYLTPCVSGNKSHTHHHFELLMTVYPVQMHALVLALFASLVAPFGGFLASAIKRAYRLKDFDSLIPGHGGVMDRMDCQFLMALCTWVHYNTFVKIATISVPKLIYMYNQLNEAEKREFLESISLVATGGNKGNRGGGRFRLDDFGFN